MSCSSHSRFVPPPAPVPGPRPLRTPSQANQHLPHRTFVVADAELLLDPMRPSRAGPQRCLVPQSFRTLQQQFLPPLPILLSQQRLAACPARSLPCPLALLPILPSPAPHRVPCHLPPPCCLRVTESFLHPPHRFKPALLQRLQVASYSCWISQALFDALHPEKVSLYYAGVSRAAKGSTNFLRMRQYQLHAPRHRNRSIFATQLPHLSGHQLSRLVDRQIWTV